MRGLRNRVIDIGRQRARELVVRIGVELKIARLNAGLSQAEVARRAGLAQAVVSLSERGLRSCSPDVLCRLAAAVGCELGALRLFPRDGVSLRDSGQLALAEVVVASANSIWLVSLEAPVSLDPRDRRSADTLFQKPDETAQLEIIRNLFDFQAQLRHEQLKRQALAQRLSVPVHLVIGLPDRPSTRRVVAAHHQIVKTVLPVSSQDIWHALRNGTSVGGDGLLWIPTRRAEQRKIVARSSRAGQGHEVASSGGIGHHRS
jgi:Helix-turn-helix.